MNDVENLAQSMRPGVVLRHVIGAGRHPLAVLRREAVTFQTCKQFVGLFG
nr:hypothetical protein [Rehaibacterium terrae]